MQINMKDIAYIKAPYKPFALADNDVTALFWHDGSATEAGTAVTAATITVTADTSITLDINGSGDARIGTAGVMDDASYATWGAVEDEVNSAKGWHCQLVGVTRDQATVVSNAGLGAVSEHTNCFKVAVETKMDSSDVFYLGVGIVDAGYGKSLDGWRPVLYAIDTKTTFTNTGYIAVFDCDDKAKTTREVLRIVTATTVLTTYPTNGPINVPLYIAPAGHRIVVMEINSHALSGAGDHVQVTGLLIKET